jgi:regulatory protein
LDRELSETYIEAYDQAIKYISIRSHTVFELRNKLLRKKFDKADVELVLTNLERQKYLNDHDFALSYTQNLIKYKTFGYYGIKMKLKIRGVGNELAEEILSEELDIEKEKKIAQKAIGKSPKKDKMKLMQMLQRKGFRGQVISSVVGDVKED